MEEEIIKLKKIIESKNQTQKKNKKMYLEKIKKEIESKMEKRKEKQIKKEIHLKKKTKIITFSGNYKSGKSTIALIISQYFSQENYIVLLIDGDMEKSDLSMILTNHQKRRSIKSKMNYFNFSYTNKKNTKKISYKKKIYNNTYKKLINKKRSIYYYKIKNKIKINTKKINKNLFFLKNLNHVIENKVTKKRQKQRKLFLNFLEAVHKNYDFIIIELSKNNNKEINREILKKSYVNFVIMEANLLGIKEVNLILKDYFCNWNIKRENLYIISNKKNINSIHKNLISKSLCIKNRILEIKENKFYKWFIDNQIFNRKQLFLNKTTKREINQMINKIQINKKIRDKKGKEE